MLGTTVVYVHSFIQVHEGYLDISNRPFFFLQERDLVSTICLVPNRVDLLIGCYVTTVFYGGNRSP